MHPTLAPNAGKPCSAKRCSQVSQEPAIHPRDAHLHLLRHTMPPFQVVGPDRGRETILGIVGHGDGLLLRIKRRDVARRTKDFLLHAARRFRQPSIDGWLHVEALIAIVAKLRNSSARNNRRAFFLSYPV